MHPLEESWLETEFLIPIYPHLSFECPIEEKNVLWMPWLRNPMAGKTNWKKSKEFLSKPETGYL